MLVTCSHCQASLDVAPEHYGQIVGCPACNGKLQIPEKDNSAPASATSKPKRDGWAENDHANVDMLKSFLIGAGVTVVFMICMVPFKGVRLGSIFLERGWVNYAESFLFFWGLAILGLKLLKNKHQEKAALLSLFPTNLGEEVNTQTVGGFIDNIYKFPVILRDSIIVNRIRKALELFETRNSNSEVSTFLGTQSDLDANRSSGSYSLIKVFLWAIPILGFIGTVMGLSDAVGSLAMGDNTDPEALKSSINNLTGGLGIAFDTTLLGLILSILLSFPLAAVQKKEDETLTFIDTFCTEKLLPKLNDSKNSTDDVLLKHADSLPELAGSLSRAHETFLDNLNASTMQLKQTSEAIHASVDKMEQSFGKAVAGLSETSSKIFLRSDNELDESFKKIATGIDLMNASLAKLGEKKIPNKKKGLFG